jgi:hypothetical protein
MDIPTGTLSHFAINADDVDASRRFYQATFGWQFEPWGPPGFFRIQQGDGSQPRPMGALQGRRDLLDVPTNSFECTVAVDDVVAVRDGAQAAGGQVLMDLSTIPGVGQLVFLADPSGNVVGAMRYDSAAE